jgi:multidrug efflux pump
MQMEDRGGLGFEELYADAEPDREGQSDACAAGLILQLPGQRAADRRRCRSREGQVAGRAVQELFDTMQVYLGSLYVNDFNAFGRTYP